MHPWFPNFNAGFYALYTQSMRSIPSPAYQSLLNPIQQCNTGCALPLIKHSTRQSFDMDS